MPYASSKQRRYMHAQHPDIAKRWDEEMRSTPGKGTPKLAPTDQRGIPERFNPPTQPKKSLNKQTIDKVKNKYRTAALKNRVTQASKGTAHQQHLAHLAHKANVKNNPQKYG